MTSYPVGSINNPDPERVREVTEWAKEVVGRLSADRIAEMDARFSYAVKRAERIIRGDVSPLVG